jgi:hypothetical protein
VLSPVKNTANSPAAPRVEEATLTDHLLHASLLCGLQPGGAAAHRYQLFFAVHYELRLPNRTNDLQRALETGVDDKGLWLNHGERGSGEYVISEAGFSRAIERLGYVPPLYPPCVGAACSFEVRGDIGGTQVRLVWGEGRFESYLDEHVTSATKIVATLQARHGKVIPTDGASAPRAIYDFAHRSGWAANWLGPRPIASLPQTMAQLVEEERRTAENEGLFQPDSLEDARRRTARQIVARQGQRAFRERLLGAYSHCCALTRCSHPDVLEAAHIIPYQGPETNHVQNDLLLRADLHVLFDRGQFAIDTACWRVLLGGGLRGTDYEWLNSATLRLPARSYEQPSIPALDWHRRWSGLLAIRRCALRALAASREVSGRSYPSCLAGIPPVPPGRSAAPPQRSMAPPCLSGAPPRPSATPTGRSMTPLGRSTALPGRFVAPPGRSAALPGQSVALPGLSVAPPGDPVVASVWSVVGALGSCGCSEILRQ